jgi:hypothetical protein
MVEANATVHGLGIWFFALQATIPWSWFDSAAGRRRDQFDRRGYNFFLADIDSLRDQMETCEFEVSVKRKDAIDLFALHQNKVWGSSLRLTLVKKY